jgi:hypothetical protein
MKRLPPALSPEVLAAIEAEREAAEASQAELDEAVDDDSCVAARPLARTVARWPHGMAIGISFSLEPLERGLAKLAADLEARAAPVPALPPKRRRRKR